MHKLFLDIETIPADTDKHDVIKKLHEKKVADGRSEKTFEDVIGETSMNGAFGRIFCICFAIDDEPVKILCADEKSMLIEFWNIAKKIDLFVGFNILDFDLRFIWQRSIIHQIKPSINIPFVRNTNKPIYDIMYEWSHWSGGVGSRIGLDGLAQAFGIPSSKNGEVTGKTVYKAYKAGKHKEICDYCVKDVEVTREVYKKINFEK